MRVLFTTCPGWGHVHPMVPLAKAFVARGDDVAWAAASEVVPRLSREGFTVIEAGLGEDESMREFGQRFASVFDLPPADRPPLMFPGLFGEVRAGPMLADLFEPATEWRPSIVIREASEFAAPIVAGKLGVPCLTHAFGTLRPEPLVVAASEVVAPLWKDHGLEPRPYGGSYDYLYLDIYPQSLRTQDFTHVGEVQSIRPVTFASPGDGAGLPDVVTADSPDPLVYVTFGTVFNDPSVVASVVRTVAELPVRVVATVGPSGDPDSLGGLPPNVAVERYIPQTELLSQCAAVVSHAGSGTFLASLAQGLPQLCLPQGADQFENAAAAGRCGAGVVVRPDEASAESIQTGVQRILSEPSYREAALRIGAEIAAMPGPDEVAGAIAARFGAG